jgi:hypothetical protein
MEICTPKIRPICSAPPEEYRGRLLALLAELYNIHGHTDAEITAELLQKGVDVDVAKRRLKRLFDPRRHLKINPNIAMQRDE